jgi:hypothetical protein
MRFSWNALRLAARVVVDPRGVMAKGREVREQAEANRLAEQAEAEAEARRRAYAEAEANREAEAEVRRRENADAEAKWAAEGRAYAEAEAKRQAEAKARQRDVWKGMIVCQNPACLEQYDLWHVVAVSDEDVMSALTGGGATVIGRMSGHPVLVGHTKHDTSDEVFSTLATLRSNPRSKWTCDKCKADSSWEASYRRDAADASPQAKSNTEAAAKPIESNVAREAPTPPRRDSVATATAPDPKPETPAPTAPVQSEPEIWRV